MKSPLSKIQRQIELIEIKQGDELTNNADLAERLRQIANISSDATKIVQKTLDEAKGKFVSIERTSLNLMIKSALDEIEIPHNIKLKNVIGESNILLDVYATRQLANVFHNLVTNGINAIHPNPGSIYIEVERMDKDWVIISVEDSGKGISKDEAQLVFLPISSTGLEGRGFGLSLTKQYIEMIGGKILPPVPGRDGVGTKFLVYLRLYTSSD
jgi:signal transduction histidine kinase